MRFVLPFLAAICLLGAEARASTGSNGLYGHVTRGPITPFCAAEESCSAPAAGAVLVFFRAGAEVARVRVGADGSYRVALGSGTYNVRAQSARPLEPTATWVRSGHFRHVDFSIDTGIR